MDIRTLACFVAVAEELHFRRAAARLHMTQPALSHRIRLLEQELGAPLFERDRRHVKLTTVGRACLEPAREAVARGNLLKGLAVDARKGAVGRLRLGFTVIAFYGVLPRVVRLFRARFPQVKVELTEMNSPLVENALQAGTIDLGVLHPPLETIGLTTRDLPPDRLMLALPEGHALSEHTVVPLAALAGQPMLVAPRAVGPAFYDRLITAFQTTGLLPNIVQEATPMTTLAGLVAAGVGLGFVTEGIARSGRAGVVFRRVEPGLPALPLAAAWRDAALSTTARRFLDVVEETHLRAR